MNGRGGAPAGFPLEQEREFFYGKYRGIVADVDPVTCRIKAMVPAVLGDTQTGWCMPCVPYAGWQRGIAFLPEEGSGVWVEFEGGDVSYPVWTGCYWRDGEPPEGVAKNVKVIVTAKGLRLVLNDAEGSITISDPGGNTVMLNEAGITLSRAGQQVVIGDANVAVNEDALVVQ
ncbi:MAG TPA: phage baseplate assembly protein V [Streptosporangiaceae bacterium]